MQPGIYTKQHNNLSIFTEVRIKKESHISLQIVSDSGVWVYTLVNFIFYRCVAPEIAAAVVLCSIDSVILETSSSKSLSTNLFIRFS